MKNETSFQTLTEVSLDRQLIEGCFPWQTCDTSSLSRCCQCGLLASNMIVQVSRSEVVSCPAKKNVLHSSIINRRSTLNFFPAISLFFCISYNNTPSKSFPYDELRPISMLFIRLSIISFNSLSTSALSDLISLLYRLGKNLYFYIELNYYMKNKP